MDVLEAAAGIRRIVDMRMADEVRVFAAKRGVDLTAFTLLPFGGAGAVHAAAVAEELGMRRILVPPRPGAFSALGLSAPTWCTTTSAPELQAARRGRRRSMPRTSSGSWKRKARDELAAEGMDAADGALPARARPALHRPGLRAAHARSTACSAGA